MSLVSIEFVIMYVLHIVGKVEILYKSNATKYIHISCKNSGVKCHAQYEGLKLLVFSAESDVYLTDDSVSMQSYL